MIPAAEQGEIKMDDNELRSRILAQVKEYARLYHQRNDSYTPGDRIPYASRVYDE